MQESTDKDSAVSGACQGSERLQSFHSRSILKRGQQQLVFEPSDEEEGISESPKQKKNMVKTGLLMKQLLGQMVLKTPRTRNYYLSKVFLHPHLALQ